MKDVHDRLHFILHDWYGYISFLLHVPFHFWHEQQLDNAFGLNGFIMCAEPCHYHYDRGYYLMNCERCYNSETKRLSEIHE